jgi:flavodoxin
MRVLVAFYSKTGRTRMVAEEIAKTLEAKKHEVVLHAISPKQVMKAYRYSKEGKGIALIEPLLDLRPFDLVFVGTPVWNFCPSPIVLSYLRQLGNLRGKRFALFSTCTGLPGTTIKRMANVLATKNAKIVDSLTIRSVFELDGEKLLPAKRFAEKISSFFT